MAVGGFERADKKVSVHEGGYVNHPKDPGGATNKGVIQRVYDSYRLSKGQSRRSVRELTEAERLDIYRTRYWDAIRGDELPAGVDYAVYDGAVNSGPIQSGRWLQRALGPAYLGTVDGVIGPETLRAARAHPDPAALVDSICDQRMAFLKALKTWPTFGKGWAWRVTDVRQVARQWAAGNVAAGGAMPVPGEGAEKAVAADMPKAPMTKSITRTIGTVAAGAPLAGLFGGLDQTGVFVMVGIGIAAVVLLLWHGELIAARTKTVLREFGVEQ